MNRRLAPVAALAAAVTAFSAGLLTIPAHAAASPRHAIPGVVPSWATPSADRGAVPGNATISARVYLASRDQAGLTRFVAAVSTPGNSQYQHYLSPAQFAQRFGSAPGAGERVSAWLRSQGLAVTQANSHFVAFRGSAAKVGAAFGVHLDRFAVGNKVVQAPTHSASVPGSLAPYVLTILGLSGQPTPNRPMLVHNAKRSVTSARPAADRSTSQPAKAFPCNAYEGEQIAKKYPKAYGQHQPYAVCGYGPAKLQGAYGITKAGYTGKGITVAVVDAYALPTMKKDLTKWIKKNGGQPLKKGQYIEDIPSGTGYNAGWAGEEALDVEAIHSVAPDANILYSAGTSASTSALLDANQRVVDNKSADAVNNSWEGGSDAGTPGSTISAFEAVFQQGAAEGIGFYFSTGDSGGLSGGQPVVTYPSIDPYVTGVGGSAIGIDQNNGYMWETAWETDYSTLSSDGTSWTPAPPGNFASGAGGGTSVVFQQPKWQQGVVPKKFSEAHGSTPMRTTPDIGADADPTTGFLEGYSSQVGGQWVYSQTRIGGTSLSSPLIVGMQADAEQAAGGKAIGFANPVIYSLYGTKAYHDVTAHPLGKDVMIAHVRTISSGGQTVVALGTAGQAADGGLASIKGYDTTTGVGTPTAHYFTSFASLR